MFVRIMLDSSQSEQVPHRPGKAVVEIETEKFVFVPAGKDADHQKFALRPVEVGRGDLGDRFEIKSGFEGRRKLTWSPFRGFLAQERVDPSERARGRVIVTLEFHMLNSIIKSSLNNRFFVLMATLLVAGVGVYSALHLPIDAVPDLTNVQVQVITEAPALSPLEVDSLLSFPVSGAMSGLPDVEQIRSVSKFGVSVVTIVFKEGTDIYRARQLVGERLPRAAEAIPSATAPRCSGRSPRRWAKCFSSRSRRPRNPDCRRWTCARCSTGSSPTSCAASRASPRSTPTAAR